MARDWRDERIAELERENAELKRENRELKRDVAELLERLARLEAQLRKLTGASDPERDREQRKLKEGKARGASPEAKGTGTGRKPGGQPGHPKHERPEVPPEQVAERHDCIPERCEKCSARLRGRDPSSRCQTIKIVENGLRYLFHALADATPRRDPPTFIAPTSTSHTRLRARPFAPAPLDDLAAFG